MLKIDYKPWILVLLFVQMVLALIAMTTAIFIFKISVAATGVLILVTAFSKQLIKVFDGWVVILAFIRSCFGH